MTDKKDGGYTSRKLLFGLLISLLITVGFFAAAFWTALASIYFVFAGSLSAVYTTYCGANYLVNKTNSVTKVE